MAAGRILFVDDDPVARRSFSRMTRQQGFIVDVAKDGEEAWELAMHFPYAVIATDLRMPGMSGMMLIDQLREVQSDPICLLITGCSDLEVEEAGADDIQVIKKPWDGEQLGKALRAAVEQHGRQRRCLASETPEAGDPLLVGAVGVSEPLKETLRNNLAPNLELVSWDSFHEVPRSRSCFAAYCVENFSLISQLARKLQSDGCPAPILALSQLDEAEFSVEALRQGAQDWLAVPHISEKTLDRSITMARTRLALSSGVALCTPSANPGLLEDRFGQAISRAKRFSRRAGILLVDVDDFRAVNMALGFEGGNALLKQIAERLGDSVRESDSLLRIEGDAFALVLEDLGERLTIEHPAQRVLNAFATPFSHRHAEVMVTASIGGAIFPEQGLTPRDLLEKATTALKGAKGQGRNQYSLAAEITGEPTPLHLALS